MGRPGGHKHDGVTFATELTETLLGEYYSSEDNCFQLPSGSYYLNDNILVTEHNSAPIRIKGRVDLCLNGHILGHKIEVTGAEQKLNLYGSENGSTLVSGYDNVSLAVTNQGAVDIYGGTLQSVFPIRLDGGYVNMYGGSLAVQNGIDLYDYGVGEQKIGSTFNLYGGTIKSESNAINAYGSSRVTISGGTCTGGESGNSVIYMDGSSQLGITGGEITSKGSYPCIWLNTSNSEASVTIKGGVFTASQGKPIVKKKESYYNSLVNITGGYFLCSKTPVLYKFFENCSAQGGFFLTMPMYDDYDGNNFQIVSASVSHGSEKYEYMIAPKKHTHEGGPSFENSLAQNGGELNSSSYYLTADLELGEPLTIPNDASVSLCLNGHRIANSQGECFKLGENAKLDIYDCQGGGRIETTADDEAAISAEDSNQVRIFGGTISGSTALKMNKGTVQMHQGTLEAAKTGIDSTGTTITVKGGTISGVERGICAQGGTLTMDGGSIDGVQTGIDAENAEITINGGSVTALTGNPDVADSGCALKMNGGTTGINGGMLSGVNGGIDVMNTGNLTINGGGIHTINGHVVNNSKGTVTIQNGYFSIDGEAPFFSGCQAMGGFFNKEPASEEIASGSSDSEVSEQWNDRTYIRRVQPESGQHYHDGISFATTFAKDSQTISSGSYILNDTVETSVAAYNIVGTVNLCLNGKSIKNSSGYVFSVQPGATLNLYDCHQESGIVNGGILVNGDETNGRGTLNLYGGKVEGGTSADSGNGVRANAGNVNVYGGKITGGSVQDVENSKNAAGIYAFDSDVTIHEGEVHGGTYGADGTYGVYVDGATNLTINGGEISNSSEERASVGFDSNKKLIINGGTISNDIGVALEVKSTSAAIPAEINGGTIVGGEENSAVVASAPLTANDGSISNNNGGTAIETLSVLTVNGGSITGRTGIIGYGGFNNIEVNGGTIQAETAVEIQEGDPSKVTINGGYFWADGDEEKEDHNYFSPEKVTAVGGFYNKKPADDDVYKKPASENTGVDYTTYKVTVSHDKKDYSYIIAPKDAHVHKDGNVFAVVMDASDDGILKHEDNDGCYHFKGSSCYLKAPFNEPLMVTGEVNICLNGMELNNESAVDKIDTIKLEGTGAKLNLYNCGGENGKGKGKITSTKTGTDCIQVIRGGTVTVHDSNIAITSKEGDGIHANNGTVILKGKDVKVSGKQNGITAESGTVVKLENSEVSGKDGNGVSLSDTCSLTTKGGEIFSGNEGNGIYADNSVVEIDGDTKISNTYTPVEPELNKPVDISESPETITRYNGIEAHNGSIIDLKKGSVESNAGTGIWSEMGGQVIVGKEFFVASKNGDGMRVRNNITTIKGKVSSEEKNGIVVDYFGAVNVEESGSITSEKCDGIRTLFGSSVVVNGGSVSAINDGIYGIYANGFSTVTVNDGKISGNSAGIEVRNDLRGEELELDEEFQTVVTLNGGTVEGQETGVRVQGGDVTLNQTKLTGTHESDLYLGTNQTIQLGEKFLPRATNEISVSTVSNPESGKPVNITGTNTSDFSQYFASKADIYMAQNGADNVVQLAGPMRNITVNLKRNNQLWTNSSKELSLRKDSNVLYTLTDQNKTGEYTAEVLEGNYDIYVGEEKTGISLNVSETSTSAEVNYYTVTYYKGDGSLKTDGRLPAQADVLKGDNYDVSNSVPLKLDGYTQKGWKAGSVDTFCGTEGTPQTDSSFTNIQNQITLYPAWQMNALTASVTGTYGGNEITSGEQFIYQCKDLTLTASATHKAGENYTYQWQQKRPGGTYVPLEGQNSKTLTVENIQPNSYDYRCVVTLTDTEHGNVTATNTADFQLTVRPDEVAPTGMIQVEENYWTGFLNKVTFGYFFKNNFDVKITANDEDSGVKSVEYLLSKTDIDENKLENQDWIKYKNEFSIENEEEYIIYARIEDNSKNVLYINSEGLVLDKTDPVIFGLEADKVYCGAVEFTVTDAYLDTVTINGTPVTPKDGKYVAAPAQGVQNIVAADKAGNTATISITVNDGHTWGETKYEWNKTESCMASHVCLVDDSHKESANATVTNAITTEAACTAEGVRTYTASFDEDWAEGQTKEEKIPALGHKYKEGECTVCHEIDSTFKPVIKTETESETASVWHKGSKDGLSFTSSAAYKHFQKVQIDGKDLDEANYEVKKGSTIVTLPASYLESLPAGAHKISIGSATGTVETTFTIAESGSQSGNDGQSGSGSQSDNDGQSGSGSQSGSDGQSGSNSQSGSNGQDDSSKKNTDTQNRGVQTGDASDLRLWTTLMLAALAAVGTVYCGRRKKALNSKM